MPAPKRTAALPGYMPDSFSETPAGHKCLLYFWGWQAGSFAPFKDARPEPGLSKKEIDRQRVETLREVCGLGEAGRKLSKNLRERQSEMAILLGDGALSINAESTAPFASGLGNEHPIENGFAFLTPYGLPYLAGSGVKGVLRRAAEELALFPEEFSDGNTPEGVGLSMLDIWWLFGFEGVAGAWSKSSRRDELNERTRSRSHIPPGNE